MQVITRCLVHAEAGVARGSEGRVLMPLAAWPGEAGKIASVLGGDAAWGRRDAGGDRGHTHLTAVVTATSSTVPHSDTTWRTPHNHVAWFEQEPACIC
jgi:hypothetical protein